MKTILLTICSLLLVSLSFAQSKKEMEETVFKLDEKTKSLENEILNIKTNLSNTNTTLGLVSKSNLDLEKIVSAQSLLIKKLINQNDSLLKAFSQKKVTDVIESPQNEADSIVFLVQSYYKSKKWEGMLDFVLNAETVKQHMKDYYSDRYLPTQITNENIAIQGSNFKLNESFIVQARNNSNARRTIYVKKTSDGFKIDWDATMGYNPISLQAFKLTGTAQPSEFRVGAEFSSSSYVDGYYRLALSDDNTSIYGYISKSSVEGKKLFEILKDGTRQPLILQIKSDNSLVEDTTVGIITKVIAKGWAK
ncbi:MAG: hypothetical protein NT021_04700 [Sphingobacteriales bacterium]|nr:hypothetical protein [Sphingobacteriales bacterium]